MTFFVDSWHTLNINPSSVLGILFELYLIQTAYYIFDHSLGNVPGPALAKIKQSLDDIPLFWRDLARRCSLYTPEVCASSSYQAVISIVNIEAIKTLYGHGTGTRKVLSSPCVMMYALTRNDDIPSTDARIRRVGQPRFGN
jgi:hypothetical protein